MEDREILGRKRELTLLREAVADAAAGRGQIVLIEGEAGIGKTCLLEACLAELADDVQVLRTGAHELDRDRPFGAFVELLSPYAQTAASEGLPLAQLLTTERPPAALHLVHDPGARPHLLEAILAALERLWTTGPLLLAVEDVQWADPESLACLYHLARRLSLAPAVILLTYRPSPHRRELGACIESLVRAGALTMPLGPLDESTVSRLATQILGAPPARGLSHQLARAAGNPLFVRSLLDALAEEGVVEVKDGVAVAVRDVVPPSLRLTILRRMAFLSAPCLEVLRLASILGTCFSPRELSLVSGRPAPELSAALREGLEAGLLDEQGEQLAFRHALVWDAIYADQARGVRQALHTAAGEALAAAGASASRVAAHLERGAVVGDAQAIEWLRRAAREAALRAPAVAVGLLTRARELARDLPRQEPLLTELVIALTWAGRVDEAEVLARDVLAGPHDPTVGTALRLVLARALTSGGRNAAAVRHVEAALAHGSLSGPEHAEILAWGALAVCAVDPARAKTWARQAQSVADGDGHDPAACIALTALAGSAFQCGDLDDAIALASESARRAASSADEEARRWPAAGAALSALLIEADRSEEAERVLRERRARSAEAGSWGPVSYGICAALALFAWGEWDDARAEGQAAIALADELGGGNGTVCGWAILALIAIHRGELEAAAQALAAAERELERVGYQQYGHWAMWARGLLAAARCARPEALAALEAVWAARHAAGSVPDYTRLGPDLVRALVAAGRREEAEHVAGAAQVAAARLKSASAQGAALRCRGLVDDDPAILIRALAAYRGVPRPLERAFAAEDAGAALARTGERGQAVAALGEALEIYERLGAVGYAARVEARLRDAGVRRGSRGRRDRPQVGWESLTATELKVVALVAEGLSNGDVARRLFVSRHTVESHVSHVFSKLGLRSRVELALEAARRDVRASQLEEV